MTHYRMLDREPSAIITVAGSEKKIYNNGQIFLNDGENFEIRFFNPLQTTISIEIIFNGQKKNDGLLVLKPGEDVILDRFLGEKKKMKYETYTIDGNNAAAVQAAALNGLVEFKFYKEKINYTITYATNWWNSPDVYGSGTGNPHVYGSSTTDNYLSQDFSCCSNLKGVKTRSLKKESIETGRIEKGPESNQNLTHVDMNFETYPFHTITYQLKPNSEKTNEVTEIRNYCSKCHYRIRKSSWNYCPKCGLKNN